MKSQKSKYKIPYSNTELVKDLWKFIKPYRGKFWLGSFFRLTGDMVWLYPSYALAEIVNFFTNYSSGDSLKKVWIIMIVWIIISIYHFTSKQLGKFFVYEVAEKATIDQQNKTIKHIFDLDLVWHEKENSGNKVKRIQKGGDGINKLIRMFVNNVIEIVVNFVGMVFIIFVFDKAIATILVFFMITHFVLSYFLTKKAVLAVNKVNITEEHISGLSFEAINNIRSVKVLNMKNKLIDIIANNFVLLFKQIRYRIICFRTRSVILDLYAQTFRVSILIFIILGVIKGHYEVGFIILYYTYFNKVWESVSELADISNDFIISRYGIWRMITLQREAVKIDEEKNKKIFPQKWQKISVQDLSFNYGSEMVLKNISFKIERGQKIGIVGLSGAGKSTMFKLLLKEYENYTGKILIDDIALKDIGKAEYLKHAATVLQETELFNFSLRQNIEIVSTKSSKNKLKHALEVAHVADFTDKLPKGIDTLIGEKGVKLSGGEKQRVGIARAVYKQPDIFFLDEATSHLDVESEEKIKDSLHQFFKDVTAVVIAHRLSTIKEMDKILVFESGKIIESGSFDELIKNKARFFELWEKQKF